MTGRAAAAAGTLFAAAVSILTLRTLANRGADRLLAAPRTSPEEALLGPALDALGGEIVRFRSRDGLRLSARWLPAEVAEGAEAAEEGAAAAASEVAPEARSDDPTPDRVPWRPDPHEAILLLHGWSGSAAPDLVEYGPFLRRTAGVLGLDFRGHGASDPSPATFGLREVEDVAGALAWLGERGIERVALVGSSMGGITALAAVAVLGDGSLPSADADPAAPALVAPPRRPVIVAVVADSVPPEIAVGVGSRLPGPGGRLMAGRLLDAAARKLGGDPRETEPIRVVALLEGTPLLLISGEADRTVPIADARRLAAAAPPGTIHLVVPRAGHASAHAIDPAGYEWRVTDVLRTAFASGRKVDPIIATPGQRVAEMPDPADVPDPANPVEH